MTLALAAWSRSELADHADLMALSALELAKCGEWALAQRCRNQQRKAVGILAAIEAECAMIASRQLSLASEGDAGRWSMRVPEGA